MAYVADAVTLSSTMRTGGFELGSSELTSSTLKWLHQIQCGFNIAENSATCRQAYMAYMENIRGFNLAVMVVIVPCEC
jgi:hypothetical protein